MWVDIGETNFTFNRVELTASTGAIFPGEKGRLRVREGVVIQMWCMPSYILYSYQLQESCVL